LEVQTPRHDKVLPAAAAAKTAGVHLVFTSVGSANRQTGTPYFESKYDVEKHIAKFGVRATILAPVSFMENLYFAKEQLAKGIYASALPPTRALAQVAVAAGRSPFASSRTPVAARTSASTSRATN
jgi:uncharacterized protein YbjT (DUF2867 family)